MYPPNCLATRGSIPLIHGSIGRPATSAAHLLRPLLGPGDSKRPQLSANRNNLHIVNNCGPVQCQERTRIRTITVDITIQSHRARFDKDKAMESLAHSTKEVIIQVKTNQNGCGHDSGVT